MTEKAENTDENAFIQAVRQYQKAGLLEREKRRRAAIYVQLMNNISLNPDDLLHRVEDRPGFLPYEKAHTLEQAILDDKQAPEPVYVHALGVQYGFTGKNLRDFCDLGGRYYLEWREQHGQSDAPQPPGAPPEGELLGDALKVIFTTIQLPRVPGGQILRPGDSGYHTKKANASNLESKRRSIFKFANDMGRYDAIAKKIRNNTITQGGQTNFEDYFFTTEEMATLRDKLRLTDNEMLRLQLAQENTVVEIWQKYRSPEAKKRGFEFVIRQFLSGEDADYSAPTGPHAALLDIVHLCGEVTESGKISTDWYKLLNKDLGEEERKAALNTIIGLLDIGTVDRMDEFKAAFERRFFSAENIFLGPRDSAPSRARLARIRNMTWVDSVEPVGDSPGNEQIR